MEHVLAGIQSCIKDLHEPHLSKLERLSNIVNQSINKAMCKANGGEEMSLKVMIYCSTQPYFIMYFISYF